MRKSILGRSVELAGLALDLRAARRAEDETVRRHAQQHVARRMGRLRGLPQKIGQIMSMSADDAKADAFGPLTDAAEPLAFEVIVEILAAEWGVPVDAVVSEIEPRGLSASLGQVHRARLVTGEDVAIKVAYPGIREAIASDLRLLGWLSAPVGDLRRGFDLADYRREIARDLEEELDYRTELATQRSYAAACEVRGVVVPGVVPRWSGERVLVTGWEPGATIDEAAGWSTEERGDLGRIVLNHFLSMLFDAGLVHGDPHSGNYRFRKENPAVVVYDFGSVARLGAGQRLALLKLITSTTARRGDPLSLLVTLGFNRDLLEPLRDKLPAVCAVLFEPFADPGQYDLSTWRRGERIEDILGDDRWNFRMAAPASLILLMRAFRGVVYYLERLGRPVCWSRLLQPIADRHAAALDGLAEAPSGALPARFEGMAEYLRVEVRRSGIRKVWVTLPAMAIEDLESVIDSEVRTGIEACGVDLAGVVRRSRAGGYRPGEVFTWDDAPNSRVVRVWME